MTPESQLRFLSQITHRSEAELVSLVPDLVKPEALRLLCDFSILLQQPRRPDTPAPNPAADVVTPFWSDDAALRAQILTYEATSLMTDRERAAFLGLPEGCRIRERAKILGPDKFRCGTNVWIGEGAILDAQGGLSIGDNTQIGLGVMIWSHTSHHQALSGETGTSRDKIIYKATSVGRNTFIGGPSVVLPGVRIGDGAVISPLTLVDRDVGAGERYSTPRIVKSLEDRVSNLEKMISAIAEDPRTGVS